MPKFPTFLQTDLLDLHDDLSFEAQAEQDIDAFSFNHVAQQAIQGFQSLLTQPKPAVPEDDLSSIVKTTPAPAVIPRSVSEAELIEKERRQQVPAQTPNDIWTAGSGAADPTKPDTSRQNPTPASGTPASMPTGEIDNSSRESFVRTAYPHALAAAGGNKDAAEMMLAAAISENGDVGTGKPFFANNFYGIKGEGPAGSRQAATWEAGPNGERINTTAGFAAYNTPQEGIRGFFDFLEKNPRYSDALARYRQTGDATQLFRDVNAAGYATDQSWASKVANIRQNQVAPLTAGLEATAPAARPGQTTPPVAEQTPAAQAQAGNLRPTQFAEGLSNAEAVAACGLAAATAFALKNGRNPTVAEARNIAANKGLWSVGTGMYGAQAEVALLKEMGVATRLETSVDFAKVRRDVQSGNPVIFDTTGGSSGHYYVVEGARQRANGEWEYNLGTSATDLRASGGRQWFSEAEIPGLGFGSPLNAIYMDSPLTAQSSPTAGRSRPKPEAPVVQGVAQAADTPPPPPADQDMLRQPLGDDALSRPITPSVTPPDPYDQGYSPGYETPDGYQVGAQPEPVVNEHLWPAPLPLRPGDNYQTELDRRAEGSMYRQPLGSTALGAPPVRDDYAHDPLNAAPAVPPVAAALPASAGVPSPPADAFLPGDGGVAPQMPGQRPFDPDQGPRESLAPILPPEVDPFGISAGAPTWTPGQPLPSDLGLAPTQGPPAPTTAAPLDVGNATQQAQRSLSTIPAALPSAEQIDQAVDASGRVMASAGLPNVPAIGRAIGTNAPPIGGLGPIVDEMTRIQDEAATFAAERGHPDRTGGLQAVHDPDWRAANPEQAARYDDLERDYGVNVLGQTLPNDTPRPDIRQQAQAALSRLDDLRGRLTRVEDGVRAAEQAADPDAIRTADQAYSAVRREYDRAVDEFSAVQRAQQAHDANLEQAGYGRPLEQADVLPTELAAREGPGTPSRVRDEVPRTPGLNAVTPDVASGAAGAGLGAASGDEDMSPEERAQRAAGVAVLGVLGRRHLPAVARALPVADPARVAAEAARGAANGQRLNRALQPAGSAIPRAVRAANALTDDKAALRWAEDVLTSDAGRGRLPENAPERPSAIARRNADSVAESRVRDDLAPVVAAARQEGLLDEVVQGLEDLHARDHLAEVYRQAELDFPATNGVPDPRALDAVRRAATSADTTWEAVTARLEAQEQRLTQAGTLDRVNDLMQPVWDHNRASLDRRLESGRITPEQHAWLAEVYPHYVPTIPVSKLDPKGGSAGGGAARGVSASRGVGDASAFDDLAVGVERLNPLIASRDATIATERVAQKNEVFQAFARLYDEAMAAGGAATQGDTSRFAGAVAVTGRVDGVTHTIRVPKPIADALDTTAQMGAGSGAVGLWKRAMSGVTTSITGRRAAFLPVNLARDFGDALLRAGSEYGPTAIPEYLGLWFREAGNAAADLAVGAVNGKLETTGRASEYLARGGGMGPAETGWKAGQRWYRDVQDSGGKVIRSPSDVAGILKDLATFRPVMAANERTELISRTAMMELAERRGAGDLESMIAGRNASIDFQRAGTVTRMFNGAIPFLNATVQSGAQFARTVRDHPKSATATAALVVGLPVAAAEVYNRSDPQRAQAYDDVPQHLKDQGIVLMLPWAGSDARGERPNYLWLPLGMGAPVAIAIREAMRDLPALEPSGPRPELAPDASGPERVLAVANEVFSVFSPVKGDSASATAASLVPPVAKQAVELGTNKNLYTGSEIATDATDQRATAVGKTIASAAQATGRAVGSDFLQEVRPSQIDYLARQLPAYGDVIAGTSDMVAPSASKQTEDRPIQNAPVVGAVTGRIVRDTGGANMERAQNARLSPAVRDALIDADMRPSDVLPVPSSLSVEGEKIPLMRDEQVRYQERTNVYADREVATTMRSAEWRARGADREKLIREAFSRARDRAEQDILRRISPSEQRRRVRDAESLKAS